MSLPQSGRPRLEQHRLTLLLERLADTSVRCETFTAAVAAALPLICEYAEWHAAHAYIVQDGDRGEPPQLVSAGDWYVKPESGILVAPDRARKSLSLGEGLPGLVWESQEPVCLSDVRSMDPRFLGRPKPAVKSWYGVPVICDGEVQAVLEFVTGEPHQMHVELVMSAAPIGAIVGSAYHRERRTNLERDIEARKPTLRQMNLLAMALEQADDMVALFDRDDEGRCRFCYVNDAFLSMTGFIRDEVLGRNIDFLKGPHSDEEQLQELDECVRTGHAYRSQMAFARKDGSEFWIDVNARPIRGGTGGEVDHAVVVCRDVTEARQHAQRLSYEAAHDQLTGLYNRRYFEQALENALHGTPDDTRRHALLFIDLDGFKCVNDTYGHETGDKVLAALAALLHGHMREGDVFARLGGDEFSVLLHDCAPDAALRVAQHLLDLAHGFAYECDGASCTVGLSIGIACGKAGTLRPSEAMRDADMACYAAKRSGGNQAAMANSAERADLDPNSH